MEPLLETRDLQVVYPGGSRALHPTTLSIWPGEFVVLLGSSGAGKSSLLRCLNGMVAPSSGSVIAAGVGDISDARRLRAHRRQTGMVFQQHHLIGRVSVLANVLTGRLGYQGPLSSLRPWSRNAKEVALSALDRVGLTQYALKRADQLSGGQQQRVGIARALAQKPRILLADEPVASLDPATAEHVLTLLHQICKNDGLTAVVSLHQVEYARRFADRVLGLCAGSVLFDRSPDGLSDRELQDLYRGRTSDVQAPAQHPSSHVTRTQAILEEVTP